MRLFTEVVGQPDLEKKLRALGQALNTQQILDEGAALMFNRTRSRFLAETSPDGVKWPVSKAAIRRAASGRGGGTLFDVGKMFRSLQVSAEGPDSRGIGTNATSPKGFPYPLVHNFGLGFPKRQFLGFNQDDVGSMTRMIIRRITEALAQ